MNGNGSTIAGSPRARAAHARLNDTTAPFPDSTTIGEVFEEVVERLADRVAVVHRDRALTYRELNRDANAVAHTLLSAGVGPGCTVLVAVERSPELVAALVAIVKCGAAYLPVDLAWPSERLRDLVERVGVRVAISDRPGHLRSHLGTCVVLDAAIPATGDHGNPTAEVGADHIAYVNFTSGSTGRPKGVPIEHRSVLRLLFGARYAELGPRSVLVHLAPVFFDAATFEIWGALLHGGTCVLYPDAFLRLSTLKRLLDEHRVTVLFLTTALFNTVIDEAPDTLAVVGTVLTGGEAHSVRHIRSALEQFGPGRVVSVYGPTEATTFATFYPIVEVPDDQTALPIGTPIQNTRAYVVAGERLCEPGETGEVLLAGPGLSPGYLGMPDITAERFIARDVDGVPERLYRTGDLAYLDTRGQLVFQGRTDDQVKINGHRIELGEVAHHLQRDPEVRQCYVTTTDGLPGERRLLAFVVPVGPEVSAADVRDRLATRVPGYLVPSEVHLCTSLPLMSTAKIDRLSLLAGVQEAVERTHDP